MMRRKFFWNVRDLARKLEEFKDYYNSTCVVHRDTRAGWLAGITPSDQAGGPSHARAALAHYGWQQHCCGQFQIPIAA